MNREKSVEVVLATNNLGKIRELREIFKSLAHIDFTSLMNYPHYEPPQETGSSFAENAALKAEHAAQHLKKWVLADDSGLVVPGLGGLPGVISRRYAGPGSTDAENRRRLLSKMEGMEDLERSAYFECCLVLAGPEGLKKSVTGRCEGHILTEEKGNRGFGYDSLFCMHDYGLSFAEIEDTVKNRISHRHKAAEKMIATLENIG